MDMVDMDMLDMDMVDRDMVDMDRVNMNMVDMDMDILWTYYWIMISVHIFYIHEAAVTIIVVYKYLQVLSYIPRGSSDDYILSFFCRLCNIQVPADQLRMAGDMGMHRN